MTIQKLCEVCNKICPLCKRAESRMWHLARNKQRSERGLQHTPLITDEEACLILGCKPRMVARLIDEGEIYIDKGRKVQRVALVDVLNIKYDRATKDAKKVLPAMRTDILSILDRFAIRKLEDYCAIDDMLAEYGLAISPKKLIYGRKVVQLIPPIRGWYVYYLCRPDGEVFYVGKGQGARMYNHAAEARAGVKSHKCNIIRKIWRAGKEIIYRVVFVTTVEQEAYLFEAEEIRRIGIDNLSNMQQSMSMAHRQVIPRECYTYAQFTARFARRGENVPEDVLFWWSRERRQSLRAMRDLAQSINYAEATTTIDRELDMLDDLHLRQTPMFDRWTNYALRNS